MPISPAADEFLERHMRTIMITLRKDGSPTAHPMSGFYGGALYLNMYRDSPKSRNLERDSRICCVVTTETDSPDFTAAVLKGTARHVSPEEAFSDNVAPGLEKARVAGAGGSPRSQANEEAKKRSQHAADRTRQGIRVVYEIVPREAGFLQALRKTRRDEDGSAR